MKTGSSKPSSSTPSKTKVSNDLWLILNRNEYQENFLRVNAAGAYG